MKGLNIMECVNTLTIRDIYNIILENHRERIPFIYNWRKNYYTFCKMKVYQATSAFLVYWLLKTKIKPNTITVIYALAGLLGGFLLAIPTRITVILAGIIFFSKGILDASDGQYARISGQTSQTGEVLDSYGAHIGALGLQIGLGFFVAHKSGMILFYYFIPIIPLCYAANFIQYAKGCLIDAGPISKCLESETIEVADAREPLLERPLIDRLGSKWLKPLFVAVKTLLDNRSHSVDFICLLAVIEMYSPLFLTWIIFLLFVSKQVLIFTSTFYHAVAYDWPGKRQTQIIAGIRANCANLSKENES